VIEFVNALSQDNRRAEAEKPIKWGLLTRYAV